MDAIVIIFYILFGIGCFSGYHHRIPFIFDLFEVLSWPVSVGALLVAALKKYLELE